MKTTETYGCKKCNEGNVEVVLTEKGRNVTISVKKCDNKKCKYQYGIKELTTNNG